MKKFLILIGCLLMIFCQTNMAIAAPEDEEMVFEVSSWSEFEEAFDYSNYQGKKYTIRLMEDLYFDAGNALRSATALVDVHVRGCFVTLDFNGHTLWCTDKISSTDLESALSDFIRINLHPVNSSIPIEFRLIDSVGGGGVSMNSHRAYDNQLAALHVVDACNYVFWGSLFQKTHQSSKLIIDGGDYYLKAKTEKVGKGTNDTNTFYRGTVIADAMYAVEINGGTFTAKSEGVIAYGDDMCARELSAFATCNNLYTNPGGVVSGRTVINGGTFISDGYAIHHFDHSGAVDKTWSMRFPMINGGIFSGSVGYIGMSFVYENHDTTGYGMEFFREKEAADIINNDALVRCIKDGEIYNLEGLTVGDLHEAKSLYVISDSLFGFETLPVVTGDTTELERYIGQTENFKVLYDAPYGMNENVAEPYITIIPNGGEEITENAVEKTISYADYPDGLTVRAGISMNFTGEEFRCENTYAITVTEEPKPAVIKEQPQSCKVKPCEYAEATVIADHAKSYQWYTYLKGYPIPLTDELVAQLSGVKIEGYTTPTLRIAADSISKGEYYCVVTGTDNTTTKTDRIYFTFGGAPELLSFGGGEYYEGGDAEFTMYANYADIVTWYVVHRQSGSFNIYTLDEFAELTGCEYVTSHKGIGFYDELYKATVTFKNVPESWSGKYAVGYKLMNDLETVSFNPENTLPFTLSVTRPNIISFIETQSCIEGENMTFSFEAENMSSAEWIFEKADEDGVMVAYTLDDMKGLFPDMSFDESAESGVATLVVSNVKSELCNYTLYANAVGESASAIAGAAQFNVISVIEFGIMACDENYQKITVNSPESGEYKLYVAGYDDNGALKTIHAESFNFEKGKAVYDMKKQVSDCSVVKVMLWDDNMTPLCRTYQ